MYFSLMKAHFSFVSTHERRIWFSGISLVCPSRVTSGLYAAAFEMEFMREARAWALCIYNGALQGTIYKWHVRPGS